MRITKTVIRIIALCLCLVPALALAMPSALADGDVTSVYVKTNPSVPVALMESSGITASSSTAGCTVSGISWVSGGAAFSGKFEMGTYTCIITVSIPSGSVAADVKSYINGELASSSFDEGSRTLTMSLSMPTVAWAPTITKQPSGETVNEGGVVGFIASANQASSNEWSFIMPDGVTIPIGDISSKFPGTAAGESAPGHMYVSNVPYEMNGWRVVCTFKGAEGGTSKTNAATITVNPDPNKPHATPEPTPTPTPTPSPTPSPTPEPTATPAPSSESEEHEHSFGSWMSDSKSHWKQCSCGEKSEEGEHIFQWESVKAATKTDPGEEKGMCVVCGYETKKTVPAQTGGFNIDLRWILIGFVVIVVIVLAAIIGDGIRDSRRRRRRGRRY